MRDLLKKAFGISFEIRNCDPPKGLPLYMCANRQFFVAQSGQISFLLIRLTGKESFGVIAYKKQLAKYMDSAGISAAYIFSDLTKKQRDALLDHQIPFICASSQIYLPFLGMVLNNRFRSAASHSALHMTPNSQLLFLYFLYSVKEQSVNKKHAAEALNMSQMSVTRASRQLEEMGLLVQVRQGRDISMKATAAGRELLKLGQPFLIDPVQQTIAVESSALLNGFPAAGESALGVISMLNPPAVPVVAISKDDPIAASLKAIDARWDPRDSMVRVEFWKYDPLLFAKDGIVDIVSLERSLENTQDERVRGELEDCMEAYKW